MVRYTFNLVIELGEWNHIHSELEVGLYAKDVDAIISFMVENYKDIDYEIFYSLHPQLEERVNNAALAMIPHSLDGYYYSEDDMTGYWVEFPDELKELAEVELGHPLGDPDKIQNEEPTEEELEFEEWIKEHGDELMASAEADYQERKANHVPLFPDNNIGSEADDAPETAEGGDGADVNADTTPQNREMISEMYYVDMEMEEYGDMIVDITFLAYSRFSDNEHEEHYIGTIGHCEHYYLTVDYPMDIETHECTCSSTGTPVHEITIAPVSEDEAEKWRQAAHRHVDICRQCDKEEWTLDHPEYRGDDYEMERAYRLIDGSRDLENARIDAAQKYAGGTIFFRRN